MARQTCRGWLLYYVPPRCSLSRICSRIIHASTAAFDDLDVGPGWASALECCLPSRRDMLHMKLKCTTERMQPSTGLLGILLRGNRTKGTNVNKHPCFHVIPTEREKSDCSCVHPTSCPPRHVLHVMSSTSCPPHHVLHIMSSTSCTPASVPAASTTSLHRHKNRTQHNKHISKYTRTGVLRQACQDRYINKFIKTRISTSLMSTLTISVIYRIHLKLMPIKAHRDKNAKSTLRQEY